MSISGLVITLAEQPDAAAAALERLQADARIEVGVRDGRRLAVVAETPSVGEDRTLLDELEAQPGIQTAHVVFVDFGEAAGAASTGPSSHPGVDPS